MQKTIHVGFLGAGKIARAHSYALDALRYYYADSPTIEKVAVASPTPESREGFACQFGFANAVPPEAIWDRADIDTLYILGPNHTHTPQLLQAATMPHIQHIYVEKPVGVSREDINNLEILDQQDHGKLIMMGFQFLQKSPLRKALPHWRSGVFGDPIHFRAEFLHSSYLDPQYRRMRQNRFQPIPIDGAAVDLGSHVLSLLTAFLGNALVIKGASASGKFADVPADSDLCTTVLLEETTSGAAGTLIASRVSAGTGSRMILEIYGTRGTLVFNTANPDSYESYLPAEGWRRHEVLSDYSPEVTFPSHYAPSGWLRALVHQHYLFLGGKPGISCLPDLAHGIQVQRLLQEIADHINEG